MSESERVLRDLLDVLLKEDDPEREWERLLDAALAEARQEERRTR